MSASSVKTSKKRSNSTLIRGAVIGGGIFGMILFARRSRLFTTYEKVSQIPREVFAKGIELRGIVRAVHPNGLLKVEHKPIIKLPSFLSQKRYGQPVLLDLRLAGIDVSYPGSEFISKDLRLRSAQIIFTAIRPLENNKSVDAEVYFKRKPFFQTNLNVELVRRGYAKVLPLDHGDHVEAMKTLPVYSRLISKLIMSEKIADRRGLGMWRRDTWAETVVSYPSMIKQLVLSAVLTRFLLSLVVLTKELVFVSGRFFRRNQAVFAAAGVAVYLRMQQLACALYRMGGQLKYKIDKYTSK